MLGFCGIPRASSANTALFLRARTRLCAWAPVRLRVCAPNLEGAEWTPALANLSQCPGLRVEARAGKCRGGRPRRKVDARFGECPGARPRCRVDARERECVCGWTLALPGGRSRRTASGGRLESRGG